MHCKVLIKDKIETLGISIQIADFFSWSVREPYVFRE